MTPCCRDCGTLLQWRDHGKWWYCARCNKLRRVAHDGDTGGDVSASAAAQSKRQGA